MAESKGKSISELGGAVNRIEQNDLALISQKQSNGTYVSKAASKAAFETITVNGDRDAATRSSAASKALVFVDSTSSHNRSGSVSNEYYTGGGNATKITATKQSKSASVSIDVGPALTTAVTANADVLNAVGPSGQKIVADAKNSVVEFYPPSNAGNGGTIDFHYNGSTSDYTSRIRELQNELLVKSDSKNVEIAAGGSNKVVLSAAANNTVLSNQPTNANGSNSLAVATVGWVLSQQYLSEVDTSWKEALALLKSMINENSQILYVNQTSGNDSNDGTTEAKALKSITQAVTLANKRKFIGNAQCTIKLIGDYTVSLNSDGTQLSNKIFFNHPDMVEDRYITLDGSYSQNGTALTANIVVDFKNGVTGGVKNFYLVGIEAKCNTRLKNLVIRSVYNTVTVNELSNSKYLGTYTSATSSINAMTCYNDKLKFIYDATKASIGVTTSGNGHLQLQNVSMSGFQWGIYGDATINNVYLSDCVLGLKPKSKSMINFSGNSELVCSGHCEAPFTMEEANSMIQWYYGSRIDVLSCYHMMNNTANGAIQLQFYNSGSPSYAESGQKFGMFVHNIVKRNADVDASVDPRPSGEITAINQVSSYVKDLFGANTSTALLSSTFIAPTYGGNDGNYGYSIGPASYTIIGSLTYADYLSYYKKMFNPQD